MYLVPNYIIRWLGILIIALIVMAGMVIVMAGKVMYSSWSEGKITVAAIEKAGKILEEKDQKLALREEHMRYLETYANKPIPTKKETKREGK